MIKLFESNATSFFNNGLGIVQPIKCIEYKKKSLNGWYVDCEFPIEFKDKIVQDAILYVETKEKGGQPFRCSNPKYKDNKIVVTANHVIFDSAYYVLEDVRPTDLSPVGFLNYVNERTETPSPFIVSSDVTGSGTKYFVRKTLLDAFKETEALFGGSYDVDGFSIILKNKVGNDDGFSISYGKNLQSITVVEDWTGVCTKLMPVGPNGLLLPEMYLYTEVQYEKPYTRVIEFGIDTSYVDEEGNFVEYSTEELEGKLRNLAMNYINDSYVPKVNYSVKSDVPQSLCIGDVIRVKHPIVMINTEVQSYSYNVISKRVLTVEFGNYERDVKTVVNNLKQSIENANSVAGSVLEIVNKQTELINNLNKNGYVYIDENEILVLDSLPKEEAIEVWRFGIGGLAFSNNGYAGPYEFAFTQDGYLNASFIKANSIMVDHLTSDVASSLDLSSNTSIKSIVDDINSNVSTSISQTKEDITMTFNTQITNIENGIANDKTNLSKYIRFDGGIELGSTENNVVLNMENDEVAFVDTTNASNHKKTLILTPNSIELVNLTGGKIRFQNFAWYPRESGNLSFTLYK